MAEVDHFLLELTTEVNFRGARHTISSEYQPVFTGDEHSVFLLAFEGHARAQRMLAGFENEGEQ